MRHNTDRKPQTTGKTTLIRQNTGWEDYQSPSGILRGDRPTYDRQCKKAPPVTDQFLVSPVKPSAS